MSALAQASVDALIQVRSGVATETRDRLALEQDRLARTVDQEFARIARCEILRGHYRVDRAAMQSAWQVSRIYEDLGAWRDRDVLALADKWDDWADQNDKIGTQRAYGSRDAHRSNAKELRKVVAS